MLRALSIAFSSLVPGSEGVLDRVPLPGLALSSSEVSVDSNAGGEPRPGRGSQGALPVTTGRIGSIAAVAGASFSYRNDRLLVFVNARIPLRDRLPLNCATLEGPTIPPERNTAARRAFSFDTTAAAAVAATAATKLGELLGPGGEARDARTDRGVRCDLERAGGEPNLFNLYRKSSPPQ